MYIHYIDHYKIASGLLRQEAAHHPVGWIFLPPDALQNWTDEVINGSQILDSETDIVYAKVNRVRKMVRLARSPVSTMNSQDCIA
jgi:hypothetical protein